MAKQKKIGVVLKKARVRLQLTADDVAESCNVSRSRVYMWEAGDYVMPKNFPVLSEVLHIPVKRLRDANGRRV